MNEAKVKHLRDALVITCFHLLHGRKNADHGVVDPDVDGAKLALHLLRGSFHRVEVRNISGNDDGGAAAFFALLPGGIERFRVAREQGELCTLARVCVRDGAS